MVQTDQPTRTAPQIVLGCHEWCPIAGINVYQSRVSTATDDVDLLTSKEEAMCVHHERCRGIDVHKRSVTACLL